MQIRDRIKELRRVPASELIPNPKNWRTHPTAQQDALRGVLAEVGYADALIARETPEGLMLVDGHLRAETTPDSDVPVLVLDINEAEADLMLATLDPLAAMAGRDEERLTELLSTVSSDNATVNALLQTLANGYEPLTLLEPEPPDEGFDADGAMDDVEADDYEPTVQRGEVWSLGQHRLMCGDATSADDVTVLMDGELGNMVFTDPPYGVGYTGQRISSGRFVDNKRPAIQGDDVDAGWLYEASLTVAMPHLTDKSAFYVWFAASHSLTTYHALVNAGIRPKALIIWHKVNAGFGNLNHHYKHKHEPCIYGSKNGFAEYWHGPNNEVTVWDVAKQGHNDLHPTMKPVELPLRAITNSIERGQVVLDPFVGSGTTIIAAERLGRRCYAMEIEPRYCDVVIQRWEDYTGGKACLLSQ